MGRYIRIDSENKVVGVRYGREIVEGEVASEHGDLGQIMQPDGSFIEDDIAVTPGSEETQLDRIEITLDLLLLKSEGII